MSNIESFPGNSQNPPRAPKTSKDATPKSPEEKEVKAVVTGKVVQKPRSLGRRFKELFIAAEFKNTSRYVFRDVIVPMLKDMVVQGTNAGVQRAVHGQDVRRGAATPFGVPRTSYDRITRPIGGDRYGPPRRGILPDQPPHIAPISHRANVNDVILADHDDAQAVLRGMYEILEAYDAVSVADMHELANLPSAQTDFRWGWMDLRGSDVKPVREGWLLQLPRPEPI